MRDPTPRFAKEGDNSFQTKRSWTSRKKDILKRTTRLPRESSVNTAECDSIFIRYMKLDLFLGDLRYRL